MTTKVVFFVFLFPILLSLTLGSYVMTQVLHEPKRDLNLWPFKSSEKNPTPSDSIIINSLQQKYSTTTPVNIKVLVSDPTFDCGDLYITIYDLNTNPKQVTTQSGYFGQCFQKENSMLPIDDEFSEKIDKLGKYEIVAEMSDKHYKKTITTSEKFSVE